MGKNGGPLHSIVRMYRSVFPNWIKYLGREISDCQSVLDLGCGCSSPIQYVRRPFSVGVEIHPPYLEESRRLHIHSQYIRADITRPGIKPKSFDAVIATDVLEHLTRSEGEAFLESMETLARKKVIVMTPNGYVFQDGYDGNPFQEHRSAWTVNDLQSYGFRVQGILGWRLLRGYMGRPRWRPASVWNRLLDLTQLVTQRAPQHASSLFAVKDISGEASCQEREPQALT